MELIKQIDFGKTLAVTLIALDVLACLGYAIAGDTRRAIYWGAAAVLTATVTF